MDTIKEHCNLKYRHREMIRLCKNLFSCIEYRGIVLAVKKDVEQDMVLWNRDYHEEISCEQLVDFIAQVVEGVFGKSINPATKSSPGVTIPDQSEPENG